MYVQPPRQMCFNCGEHETRSLTGLCMYCRGRPLPVELEDFDQPPLGWKRKGYIHHPSWRPCRGTSRCEEHTVCQTNKEYADVET